jgi:hypothetical protein
MTLCGVLTLVAAFGCDDGAQGPTPEPPGAESPAEALEAVALSFNQRDIKVLASALSENFVFYFDPHDVGQRLPGKPEYKIPASWSYNEFWPAAKNMFDEAYSINMAIPTGRVGTPGENETTYRADNVSISLLVMITELDGFIAEKGYCNFEFERYEAAGGKKYWRLTAWWDRTSQGYDENPGVAPTSLGRILALYK